MAIRGSFNILRQVARGYSYQEVAAVFDLEPEEVVATFLEHFKEFYSGEQLNPRDLVLLQLDEVVRTMFDAACNSNVEERYLGGIMKVAVDALKLKAAILGILKSGDGSKDSTVESFFKNARIAVLEQREFYKKDRGIGNRDNPTSG